MSKAENGGRGVVRGADLNIDWIAVPQTSVSLSVASLAPVPDDA